MLQGAIIGAIVGVITALFMILMQSRRSGKFLAAIAAGQLDEARLLLDKWHPQVGKIPLSKILNQCDRMAGLTLVRDLTALDREVREHTGHLSAVGQVDSIGLLGLALLGSDPAEAAHRLGELANRVELEGGRSLSAVKKKVGRLAQLGRALAGDPLDDEAVQQLEKIAGAQGKLSKLVILQAIGEVFERAGKPAGAKTFKGRVRQETRAFEQG